MTTQAKPVPGKGLGIAGFVLAFTGVHIVGLILSIVGYAQSKKAGFQNPLALAGIILNILFFFLTIILVAITIVSYNGITARANTSQALANATAVQKVSELYNADNGYYPEDSYDLATYSESTTLPVDITVMDDISSLHKDNGKSTVVYVGVDEDSDGNADGAQIYYWDFALNGISPEVLTAGTVSN